MKIGITGGAGFIGGHVVDVALERGHDVVVFDRTARTHSGQLVHRSQSNGYVQAFMGDVRDATAMTELAAHVDGIIHLAACLGTQETIQNPRPAAETNIVGGLNFLEACTQYHIPGVYIGVGNHWMNNTYSISKTTVERFVQMFNTERDGLFNIVRLVNAYGPRQSVAPPYGPAKVRKIMPSFIARALLGDPIEVYGNGSQVSDMVHVRDGAEALVRSLENAEEGMIHPGPVEVGTPNGVQTPTVADVAKLVRMEAHKITGQWSDLRFLPMRPGETEGTPVVADTDTLHLVRMDPRGLTTLTVGVEQTVQWYAENWLLGYVSARDQVDGRDPENETVNELLPGC